MKFLFILCFICLPVSSSFAYMVVGSGAAGTSYTVNDTFTGSDGTLLNAHTGETGATWTKNTNWSAGTHGINSNRLTVQTANSSTSSYYASGTPATADYTIEADVYVLTTNATGAEGRIAARAATGAKTAYSCGYKLADGGWVLGKWVTGTYTAFGSALSATLTAGNTYHMKMTVSGSTISCWVDGTLVKTQTDTTITDAGKAAVVFVNGSSTTGYALDNFIMY